jgi:L-threonylcarbamoyladenylate synthase
MLRTIQSSKNTVQNVVEETVAVLKNGGLVIFPSDTVYGALVDATNEDAVRKLIAFKNRPVGKPISVFVDGFAMLKQHVKTTEKNDVVIKELLPGPFTIILPSQHNVSQLLESEGKTLGVRIPKYPLINELVKTYGGPVTATSANLAGRSPHYSISSLLNELPEAKKNLIDLIVDAGQLSHNKPSTVLDLHQSDIKTLRKGDVTYTSQNKYESKSPEETKRIAKQILSTHVSRDDKPLIFIISGDLGAGKTVFVKGIGEALGVEDVDSPTYVVYYEYPLQNHAFEKLIHFDLYQVEEAEEFKHLGIENMLQAKNILCFEWGEKSAELLPLLKEKASLLYITISHVDEDHRKIEVKE